MCDVTAMRKLKKIFNALGIKADMFGLFQHGVTIGEYKNISTQSLESIYAIAYSQLIANNLKEAEELLLYLCIHNHTEMRYMSALGFCMLQANRPEHAVLIFKAVDVVDRNPENCFHMYNCYKKLNDEAHANEMLERIIAYKDIDNKYGQIKNKVKSLYNK